VQALLLANAQDRSDGSLVICTENPKATVKPFGHVTLFSEPSVTVRCTMRALRKKFLNRYPLASTSTSLGSLVTVTASVSDWGKTKTFTSHISSDVFAPVVESSTCSPTNRPRRPLQAMAFVVAMGSVSSG
jgi:hypothetical protein